MAENKKLKFTAKQELEAEIRNKLTMPLTVLNQFADGKHMPKKKVVLAIKSLNEILEVFEWERKTSTLAFLWWYNKSVVIESRIFLLLWETWKILLILSTIEEKL